MHISAKRSGNVVLQGGGVAHSDSRHHLGHHHLPPRPMPPLLSFYFPLQNETSGDSAGHIETDRRPTHQEAKIVLEKGLHNLHVLHLPHNNLSADLHVLRNIRVRIGCRE